MQCSRVTVAPHACAHMFLVYRLHGPLIPGCWSCLGSLSREMVKRTQKVVGPVSGHRQVSGGRGVLSIYSCSVNHHLLLIWVTGRHWRSRVNRQGYTPDRSPVQQTITLTLRQFRDSSQPALHVFGLWEEMGEPGQTTQAVLSSFSSFLWCKWNISYGMYTSWLAASCRCHRSKAFTRPSQSTSTTLQCFVQHPVDDEISLQGLADIRESLPCSRHKCFRFLLKTKRFRLLETAYVLLEEGTYMHTCKTEHLITWVHHLRTHVATGHSRAVSVQWGDISLRN